MKTAFARPSLLALLAASALVSACASTPKYQPAGPTNPLALTPTEQYSATLVEGVDEILLASTGGLSPNQADALGALVMRWREDGGEGPIVVASAPGGPAGDTAKAAAQAIVGYGVPPGAVQVAEVAPQGPALEPVRVAFARLEVVTPDCSTRWGEPTRTRDNTVTTGFGCAITSNMAAQLANPRDLLHARAGGATDGDRRADVLARYRKGQPTETQRSSSERGVVSNAIQ
jgi:pilus assembly protein CpaD